MVQFIYHNFFLYMWKTKKALILMSLVALTAVSAAFTIHQSLADDYMYVKPAHLNVRSAPKVTLHNIVATVDVGYKATVLESLDNGWTKVLLENGTEGYTKTKFLTSEEPKYETVTAGQYTVNVGRAFVRGDDLKRSIAIVKKGEALEVVSDRIYNKNWIRVRVLEDNKRYAGRVGYIHKKLVVASEGYAYTAPVVSEETVSDYPSTPETTVATPETTVATPETTVEPATTSTSSTDDADTAELMKIFGE